MTETASQKFESLAEDTRPVPKTAFDFALLRLLNDLFDANPTWATQIGFHAFDDRWPDMTESGRHGRLAILRRHRAALEALTGAELSQGEQIDRHIVLEAIDALEFGDAELREAAWDPLSYVALAGSGFFTLLARDFAPWEHRGEAFLGRMRGLPALLESAAETLTGLPGRPVSLLHTETALARLPGITDLIDQGVAEGERRAESGEDRQIGVALREEAVRAKAAIEEYGRRLREEVAPRAEGEGRLGAELFAAKLRHTLASDLTVADLGERARRDYDLVRAELLRLAQEAWATWLPAKSMPVPAAGGAGNDPGISDETIRDMLDVIAREHRQPAELLDWCKAEVRRLEDFCRQRQIIGLPDAPLQLTWTPVFMRAYGGAFLDPPGPLDKGLPSYFWITPPDESAGPAAVESYLREDNDRMLRLLCIHEGVPGHYLQLWWANKSPSLARAVFASGMFAEGWAVYVTQVMIDAGYGGHEPALLLNHWKFYLRAITNTLVDIGVHTGDMTQEQALALMIGGGFQEDHEAKQKWLRARLTSTQLSTYYLGSIEMWELELEARRRAAAAAGARPDVVPEQRIAGGLGETPGFDQRAHLESVISHGTPPIKWVGRILFGS